MGNSTSQSSTQIMELSNTILNSSRQYCIQSCVNTRDGFTVTIIGADVGKLNAAQYCAIQGNGCKLHASVDTSLDNSLKALSKQTDLAEDDLFSFDFGSSTTQNAYIKQQVRNSISNVLTSMCKAPASSTDDNVNVVIEDSTTGDIDLSQHSSNVNNSCFIENVAKTKVKNELISTIEQTIVKGSIFLWILIIVAAVVCLVVVGFVVVTLTRGGTRIAEAVAETKKEQAIAKALRGVKYK